MIFISRGWEGKVVICIIFFLDIFFLVVIVVVFSVVDDIFEGLLIEGCVGLGGVNIFWLIDGFMGWFGFLVL